MDIQSALAQIAEGHDLSQADTRDVFQQVMSGEATPAQIGGLLMGMRIKGETSQEIAGAAETMRAQGERRLKISRLKP